MDDFTAQYIATMLWSSSNDGNEPLDSQYTADDLAPETRAKVLVDCESFQKQAGALIEGREGEAGHDFWLTRNGHGAGFWDGDWDDDGEILSVMSREFGELSPYAGDDGLIYF